MALAMDLPTTEDFNTGGGNFLTTPGKFHALIQHAEENAMRGEKMVKGFMLELQVVLPAELAGQTHKLYLGNPDPSHKDGGAFSLKKQVAALIATNVVTPSDLGKKGVDIDPAKAHDMQVCIELELGKPSEKDGKRYLDMAYANIYHVDDPRAKSYPKDADTLAMIPAEYRCGEAFFAPLMQKPTAKPAQRVDDKDFEGL